MVSDLFHRLRAIVRRSTVERELDEELQFHVELEAQKLMARGVAREEATRQARLMLGGVEQTKEACRDARGIALLEGTLQDVRYGLRTLRRTPVFAATAVVTIALSTASIATVLTLAYTLFYRTLPVDRPDELVAVSATRLGRRTEGAVSYADYRAFRERATTLKDLAAHYSTAPLFVSAQGNADEINGAVVSANFLPMLGITPVLGRWFREDEDRVPDRDRVAIISETLWRRWFAGSPEAIGSELRINGVGFTIVGVAPWSFVGMTPIPDEIFIPTMMLRAGYRWCDDALASGCTILTMLGRIAPGKTIADAAAELTTLIPEGWRHAKPGENSGIVVRQPRGLSVDDDEPRLVRIIGAVAVVLLLVCCANLAGLLGAQAAAREGEFRIRRALGAAHRRIVRQIVTESVMLAAAGGLGGVVLSRVFTGALAALFYSIDDEGHPLRYDFSVTWPVVAATLAVALVAGRVFSIVPSLRAVRWGRYASMTRRLSTARWTASARLLAAQTASAVAILTVAALLIASVQAIFSGMNFEPSHVALIRLRPRLVKYPPARAQRFQRQVIDRLSDLPGVQSVAMVGVGAVLGGGEAAVSLPAWDRQEPLQAGYNEIGPRYFATLRTPLALGREFEDRDNGNAPRVAIVNETLAKRLWPESPAVGATLLVGDVPHQVVGVIRDIPLARRAETVRPWVFVPFWQNPTQIDSRLAIRVAGDPAAMLSVLTREVNRVDPDVPIAEAITLPERIAGLTGPLRLSATFVGYAAVIAVLLTAIGLYGTLSFSVSQRTKEIGVRMALGAPRGRVLIEIVREGMMVVATGAFVGLAAAAAGSRLVVKLLYRPPTGDWVYYVVAVVIVMGVGFGASLMPARRAASVEPVVALRQD